MTRTRSLEGRSAVVSGAGGGIGRATAIALAAAGAKVVVNDIGRDSGGTASAERVAEEICSSGGEALASCESVSDFDEAGKIIAAATEAFGAVDILVNNAGVSWQGQLWDLEPEEFEHVTASHIKGTYNCSRHAVVSMRERGFGRIINLVSRAGIHGMPGTLAYAVGKGGVFGFTNAASRDLGALGITVNAVNPASTATPMVLSAVEALEAQGEEGRERAANLRSAMQTPEQVAVLIAALAGPEAGEINGQVFLVEGNRVGVFAPLQVEQSVDREEPWDLTSLGEAIAALELPQADDPYRSR